MFTVGVGSYGVASAAFLGLLALVLAGRVGRHWAIISLILATLLWAIAGCWHVWRGEHNPAILGFLDFARSLALLFLVNDALYRLSGNTRDHRWATRFGMLVPATAMIAACLGALRLIDVDQAFYYSLIGHITIAVIGLFLIENLLQMSRPHSIWATKHLLIGAGTIVAFDLFFYTEALLFLRIDETIRSAQPVIAVLAMPLILISARRLNDVRISLPVSRGLVVSTTALLVSGAYILSVAGIAYLIRGLGWTWGPTLQLVFLTGAAMVLLTLLSSTSLRHGGRRFIERNLFTFAYDYRREWLRLVESMAKTDDDAPLDRRALMAAADLMDADGGVLFLRREDGELDFRTSWNLALDNHPPSPPPPLLCRALSTTRTALVFGDHALDQGDIGGDEIDKATDVRAWLQGFRDPWIALGLFRQDELIGLIMITRPRMQRRLTFEDLDLLAIFSHQLASYLSVEELARRVAEAEHFDRMSKHVTFVAHDLKNLISQLSLVLQQAKHHANDPAFISDSFLTVGDAVEKMTLLMRRVQEGGKTPVALPVDLNTLVRDLQDRGRCDQVEGVIDQPLTVIADPTTMTSLLDHIIDNARDACRDREDGQVSVTLKRESGMALLDITDNGLGMTRAFIETRLFKPFASTKESGFGIGMYQCRDWVRRWGGRLTVHSEPGLGTTVTMALPLAQASPARDDTTMGMVDRKAAGQATLEAGSRTSTIDERAA